MIFLSLLMLAGLTAAGYVHLHASDFIATRTKLRVTRVVLLVVGLAFGYASAATYVPDSPAQWLAFFAGFGAVHIPPAIVLLIKRARQSPKS
jgi:hypothetical protein